ncbi:transposase [Rhizobium sp. P32RR-XVIII]|uniref:transposase n=1 Tax=Rhizobium sp. P32RR-XVIII TaxID=2726738 RepID=UPI0028A60CA4|nr:transposase [Rhizobium sp. P32RR-XVIII]
MPRRVLGDIRDGLRQPKALFQEDHHGGPEEITAAKGMAALHLSRKLNVQYKTAYVLLQKLREAVGLRRDAIKLHWLVQIDGKNVGGVLRKANRKEERKDGRKKENQNGKRMCVLALREANRHAPNRTLTRVIMDENGKEARAQQCPC